VRALRKDAQKAIDKQFHQLFYKSEAVIHEKEENK